MIRPKYRIADISNDVHFGLAKEDSQPADRVSMGFDAVLAQLQELVSTLSDRVERGEAVIDRIEEAMEGLGIDLDAAQEESENAPEEAENETGDEPEETAEEPTEAPEEAAEEPEEAPEEAPEENYD